MARAVMNLLERNLPEYLGITKSHEASEQISKENDHTIEHLRYAKCLVKADPFHGSTSFEANANLLTKYAAVLSCFVMCVLDMADSLIQHRLLC